MTLFNRPRKIWGRKPIEDAAPEPLLTGALARQCVLLPEAVAVLDHLPEAGGATHVIMEGKYDLVALIVALINRIGTVDTMRISTLSFHASTLTQLLGLLDSQQVKTCKLLCCTFFKNTNKGLFRQTQEQFRKRRQIVAVSRTHAKLVCLLTATGERWALSGSANLRSCDCFENLEILRSDGVHDFFADFIDRQVSNHEGDEVTSTGEDR